MTFRRAVRVLLACVVAGSGACGSSSPPLNLSPDTGPLTLSPGDSIRIDVWRYEEFSGQFGVLADGSIAHPVYRGVRVTDIPLANLEGSIRDALRAYVEQPTVVVEPLFVVVVVGDVEAPGTYALSPATTLVQAVAAAGGPALDSKSSQTKLLRREDGRGVVEYQVDLTDPAGAGFQTVVRSGDQLVVPSKTFTTGLWIALIGAVAAVLLVVERFSD